MVLEINKHNILIIPLDNRPVSYSLPINIGKINSSLNIFIPPREIIGGLNCITSTQKLFNWLEVTLTTNKIDSIICCLDTIAYGGLIPSRRSIDIFLEIQTRVEKFKQIIKSCSQSPKIYAFSSIMRISNNNINEEEKLYWSEYGELIFGYSFFLHKSINNSAEEPKANEFKKQIPTEILDDYLETRKRNFNINKYYLELTEEKLFNQLIFSLDDAAQYGLNIIEKQELQNIIKKQNLEQNIQIKTGADEIPTSLLARAIVENTSKSIKIFPLFLQEKGKSIISRYEDLTIEESVTGQITINGAKVARNEKEADIVLILNTPEEEQNDLAIGIFKEEEDKQVIAQTIEYIKSTNKPIAIADIKNANGGDNLLVQEILKAGVNYSNFYGYAGWNTTGNTLGSVISMAVSRFIAEQQDNFNLEEFKKLLFVRFSDDWAYQTIARQKIRAISNSTNAELLNEELNPYIQNICKKLDIKTEEIKLSYPWNRTFEVEIDI